MFEKKIKIKYNYFKNSFSMLEKTELRRRILQTHHLQSPTRMQEAIQFDLGNKLNYLFSFIAQGLSQFCFSN